MKKLINRPDHVVEEMLQGLVALHPELTRLEGHNVIVRSDIEKVRDHQVSTISGGGSGHEPAHAGYVGAGMLSAAVAGEVFTSPPTKSVLAAIAAVTGKPGSLLIVKNYTGDRLNFGFAAQMAQCAGLATRTVVVADDVALSEIADASDARGIAGTVLVHKIAGAAAAEERPLDEVASIAQSAADSIGTIGLSLYAGTSPVTGKPSFSLEENELELGLGIHGEPGIQRMSIQRADDLVEVLVQATIKARQLHPGDRVAVLVNNLGSTTPMELAIAGRHVYDLLKARHVLVERLYAGTFLTSLDMAGISLSIMRVNDEHLRWLDAPTSAPGWPQVSKQRPSPSSTVVTVPENTGPKAIVLETAKTPQTASSPAAPSRNLFGRAVIAACDALIESEEHLNDMDRAVGDGDIGTNLARAARAVKTAFHNGDYSDIPAAIEDIGAIVQDSAGGSSGPLYGVFFLKAAQTLKRDDTGPSAWAEAALKGCEALAEVGGALRGDRTMLDALLPFAETLRDAAARHHSQGEALASAAGAAEDAARSTAEMIPRRGRSRYINERALGHPDPGATAASIWLRAIVSALA